MNQKTVAKDVVVTGVGLHAGEVATVVLRAAKAGEGVRFWQNGVEVPVAAGLVKVSPLCTLVESEGIRLSTVEHLMAALHGLGIDTAVIEVEGPEVPILDGSALPWVEAIDAVGRVDLGVPANPLVVREAVEVVQGAFVGRVEPFAGGLRVDVTVDYPHPLVGAQVWRGVLDEATFRAEIAPARTFVLEKDIEAARAAGLIKGGGLENAVVFGADGLVKNPEGLRFPDEPVRHKVLDVLGDFYMQGRGLVGALTLSHPGHGGNNGLLRKVISAEC